MFVPAVVALALASLSIPAAAAAGQQSQSNPWEPWYGCWRAANAPDQTVCVIPEGGGIRLVTLEQGSLRGDSRIYADGVARQREQDGCTMDEWARWSSDRERVFLTSELTCDGRVTRRSQGMLAFTSPDEWLSVQTISGEEGSALRTLRFSPAVGVRLPADLAGLTPVRALRVASVDPVDEADVVEATDVLDPETVQEWLRVAGAPFQVTDDYDGSVTSSALDDLAGLSRPVEYRTVNIVRILEPSWCIYGSCSWLRSAWCWDPWGYDRFGWRTVHPVIYVGRPVLIHLGVNFGFGRGIRLARYDGWGRGPNWWRYDYPDRWRSVRDPGRGTGWARSGGTVGPGGYRPPYGGSRPQDARPATGRVTAGGDAPAAGGTRGTAIVRRSEPRTGGSDGSVTGRSDSPGTGTVRGTAIVRRSDDRTSGTRGSVTVRRTDGGTSAPRGTTVGRSDPSAASGTRGTATGRGYSSGTGTPRGTAIIRGSESGSSSSRAPSISRGSDSRASAPSISRGSDSRASAPSISRGSDSRGSAPSVSRGSAPSVSRGSAPSVSRGSASGRGYSGSGAARGTARPRG